MNRSARYVAVFAIVLIAVWLANGFVPDAREGSIVLAAEPTAASQEPVVDSMHQFMEYVFEPNYKLLKQHLSSEPKDKNAWKPVKAASLTLAEGGNLLLIRTPEEDAEEWNELSVAVRQFAGELYKTARARDYAKASKQYRALLQKCNACHQNFADGEHQLEP